MRKNIEAALFLVGLAAIPGSIQAAVFNVSNSAQLQQALTDASVSAEDDTINVAAGSYLTADNGGARFEYLVESIDPAAGSLTIRGQGMDQSLLDGGGTSEVLDIQDYASTGSILVENLGFLNGSTDTCFAGGLAVNLGSNSTMDLTVQNCAFDNNICPVNGGAALSNFSGPVTFTNNLVTNNQATSEGTGGVFFSVATPAPLVINNNVFYRNTSVVQGGGFYVTTADTQVTTITNNTIIENEADLGGGIYIAQSSDTTANLYNNIVFGNISALDPNNADIFSQNLSNSTLNVFNNDFNLLNNSGGATLNQGSNLNVDPALVDPVGGNFQLSAGSPMIDQGDPAAPSMPNSDFAGDPRPAIAGTNPDIGAFEFQPTPSPSPTPTPLPPGQPIIQGGSCALGSTPAPAQNIWLGLSTLGLFVFLICRTAKGWTRS